MKKSTGVKGLKVTMTRSTKQPKSNVKKTTTTFAGKKPTLPKRTGGDYD